MKRIAKEEGTNRETAAGRRKMKVKDHVVNAMATSSEVYSSLQLGRKTKRRSRKSERSSTSSRIRGDEGPAAEVPSTMATCNEAFESLQLGGKTKRRSRKSKKSSTSNATTEQTVEGMNQNHDSDAEEFSDFSDDTMPGAVHVGGFAPANQSSESSQSSGGQGQESTPANHSNNNDGITDETDIAIMTAHLVNDDILRDQILRDAVMASEVKPEDEQSRELTYWEKYGSFCGCLWLLMLVVGVILGTTLRGDKELTGYPFLLELLSSTTVSSLDDLLNETTPQYKALNWLAYQDTIPNLPLDGSVNEIFLIERYVLAVLYYATGGSGDDESHWYHDYHFLSNTSVCEWPPSKTIIEEEEEELNGIRCDNDGFVTKVQISTYSRSFFVIVCGSICFSIYVHAFLCFRFDANSNLI